MEEYAGSLVPTEPLIFFGTEATTYSYSVLGKVRGSILFRKLLFNVTYCIAWGESPQVVTAWYTLVVLTPSVQKQLFRTPFCRFSDSLIVR